MVMVLEKKLTMLRDKLKVINLEKNNLQVNVGDNEGERQW